MKNFLFLLVCCLILGACADSPVNNQVIDIVETEEMPDPNKPTVDVARDSSAIPDDVYDWGKEAWAGDNGYSNYSGIQPWLQSVPIISGFSPDSNGLVQIDYLQLCSHDLNTGKDTVVATQNYRGISRRPLTKNEGGLFSRWDYNLAGELDNSLIDKGFLKVWPNLYPDKVSHFWMNSSGKFERDSDNKTYYVKCRMKVEGNIAVQIACDYYKSITTSQAGPGYNTEAFHSPWIAKTNGFQTFRYPPAN